MVLTPVRGWGLSDSRQYRSGRLDDPPDHPDRAPLGAPVLAVREHVGCVGRRQVEDLRGELAELPADVFVSVPRRDQRAKGGCCLRGLMLDGRRKSIQAMAGRLADGNEQNLQPVQRRELPACTLVARVRPPQQGSTHTGIDAPRPPQALPAVISAQRVATAPSVPSVRSSPRWTRAPLPCSWRRAMPSRTRSSSPWSARASRTWA